MRNENGLSFRSHKLKLLFCVGANKLIDERLRKHLCSFVKPISRKGRLSRGDDHKIYGVMTLTFEALLGYIGIQDICQFYFRDMGY